MEHRAMISGVICLGILSFISVLGYSPTNSEELVLVDVSGRAFLADTSDHSGIKILFKAKSPTAISDSAFTDVYGDFHRFLQAGIYDVYYNKPGYIPLQLPEDQFFSTDTVLDDVTLEPGVADTLSGNLSGTLVGDIIYFIEGDIYVQNGDTLIIGPGAELRFMDYYAFEISGLLLAQGTEADSIIFDSAKPVKNPQDWEGIKFSDTADDGCVISYCIVQHGYAGVNCGSVNLQISNCTIQENSNAGISGSSPTITQCLIQMNNSGGTITYGISSSGSPTITQCIIKDHAYGISTGIGAVINNCTVQNSSKIGIVCYGSATIAGCIVEYNASGVYCLDGSSNIRSCSISNNNTGCTLNYGNPTVQQCNIQNNTYGITCNNSAPTITTNVIRGNLSSAINSISGSSPNIIYNDFYDNAVDFSGAYTPVGIGDVVTTNANGDPCDTYFNIYLDPLQASFPDDCSLLDDSPCIDAGDPSLPYDPDGTIADMGAFYYDQGTPPAPLADFSAEPLIGIIPFEVVFTDLSTGVITDYLWNFGDGRTSTLREPVHYYTEPDTYSVSLTVSGPGGEEIEVKTDYIVALPDTSPPVAAFEASPTSGYSPLEVTFTNKSKGFIDSLVWYFGDGDSSSVVNPVHTYASADTYTVRLVVVGPYGTDEEIKTDYIEVAELPPILAEFTANPLIGVAPLGVAFTDQSIGIIDTWKWYFGDGDSSSVRHPIHTFDHPGIYTVMLTVSGSSGESTEVKSNYIHVYAAEPSIVEIEDVPSDQGGWVYINFMKSGYDRIDEIDTPVTDYFIFRRIDEPALHQSVLERGERVSGNDIAALELLNDKQGVPRPADDTDVYRLDGNYYIVSNLQAPDSPLPGIWAVVGSAPAHQEDQYIVLAPTVADSTSDLVYSVYAVSAETTIPSIYFFSQPDSGYSIDNIAPNIPQGLAGVQVSDGVQISWDPNVEHDLSHYTIYRAQEPEFIPSQQNLLVLTTETTFLDIEWELGSNYFYKLSAFDVHENESGWAELNINEIVATLLQSQSAFLRDSCVEIVWQVSGDVSEPQFVLMRREVTDDVYRELDTQLIVNNGTAFAVKDCTVEPGSAYIYRVDILDVDGWRLFFETDLISTPSAPLTLYSNHPNPFNPVTSIKYYLPSEQIVTLNIYDSSGRLISRLVEYEMQPKGMQTVEWRGVDQHGRSVSSGVYFYCITAGKQMISRKMVLLR